MATVSRIEEARERESAQEREQQVKAERAAKAEAELQAKWDALEALSISNKPGAELVAACLAKADARGTMNSNEREFFVDQLAALAPVLERKPLFFNKVMVIKFEPKKIGSFHVTEQRQREAQYQGKVGLVVKLGPGAYKDTRDIDFMGCKVEIGDWAVYRSGDGTDLGIQPPGRFAYIECRQLEDAEISMITDDPDQIV